MKLDLRSVYWSVLSAAFLLCATGCVKTDNDGPDPSTPPGSAPLTSIEVTPANTKVGVGAKQDFVATGTYSDGSTKAITEQVVWSVADTAVATVSNEIGAQGEVTGVALGATLLTATAAATDSTPAVVGTTNIEVVTATLSSIVVSIDSTFGRTPVGFTTHLKASGTYSDGSFEDITKNVTWMGLTPEFATVSDVPETKGYLTGVKAGNARISVALDGVTREGIVVISNETLVNISMTPGSATIRGGATQQFSCLGNFSGGGYPNGEHVDLTDQTTWASSDTSIVTVSNDVSSKGLATGVSGLFPGSANITATYNFTGGATVVGSAPVTRPLL